MCVCVCVLLLFCCEVISEWAGLPLPSPGDLLESWIKPPSPALQVDSFTLSHLRTPHTHLGNPPRPNTHTHEILLSYNMNEGFPVAQTVKNLPAMQETQVQSLGWEDPLENELATHSSILDWRIPWTKEPGRLQSTGLQRATHD